MLRAMGVAMIKFNDKKPDQINYDDVKSMTEITVSGIGDLSGFEYVVSVAKRVLDQKIPQNEAVEKVREAMNIAN